MAASVAALAAGWGYDAAMPAAKPLPTAAPFASPADGHEDAAGYGEPPIDRTGTAAEKWEKYAGRDVLPFWVADMDLPTAPFVVDAVRERLRHPIFGYTAPPRPAVEAFLGWLARGYGWQVPEEWLVWITGVVPGINLAAQVLAAGGYGKELLLPAPVYPPFFSVAGRAGLREVVSPLAPGPARWEMDFDDLSRQLRPATAAILFCNPQNPTGRVYERAELERLAELVVTNRTIAISDEIHCPLVLDAHRRHIPFASLDAAVCARTISLFAPTKAYNFAGLGGAVAVIQDEALRERFAAAAKGMASNVSPLAFAALAAAFADDGDFLPTQNGFLAANGAVLEQAVAGMEGLATTHVEGTYLAWLDATALRLPDAAACFEAHGLGLSDGAEFGAPGYLRFNFGCPRSLLLRGIERLGNAVTALAGL